jgi:hypothetical protein
LGQSVATTAAGAALDYMLDEGANALPEVWVQGPEGPETLERFAVNCVYGGFCVKSLGGPQEFAQEIQGKIESATKRFDDAWGKGGSKRPGEGYRAMKNVFGGELGEIIPPPGGGTAIGPSAAVRSYEEVLHLAVFEPLLATVNDIREAVEAYLELMPQSLKSLSVCRWVLLTARCERFRGCWMVLRDFDGVLVDPSDGDIMLLRREGRPREWRVVESSSDNRDRVKRCFEGV